MDKEIIFTKEQIRELEFFCSSALATRQEFYSLYDQVNSFKSKMDRITDFIKLVEKHLDKKIKPDDLSPKKWNKKKVKL